MELKWQKELPTRDSLYWFRSHPTFPSNEIYCFVLQVRAKAKDYHAFARYGSGPLSMYYNEKFSSAMKYEFAEIPEPKDDEFQGLGSLKGFEDPSYGWVRGINDRSYDKLAFGILAPWTHGLNATLIWKRHHQMGSESGTLLRPYDGWAIARVERP